MHPSGLKVFQERDQKNTQQYSFEQENVAFKSAYEEKFRANQKAWDFFQGQSPYYQKTAIWWVISAKREETRLKRLAILIDDSEKGQRIAAVTYKPKNE